VAIVNETLARRFWLGEDPVGKRLKGFDPRGKNDDWLTVVGVVKDTRSGGLERAPLSQIYEVQSQRGEQINNIVIRTAGDPVRVAAAARALVRAASPETIVSAVEPLVRLLNDQERPRRFQTWLIAAFSAIALALAALGVFAVMHYAVASKQHEIGIRMAVGATSSHILRGVVWDGARLAITGIGIGLIAASWITGALASMLFEVRPGDPVSFVVSTAVLMMVSIAAVYLPARRATRVDPIAVLRQE
jgi:predicted lysophospholipase L1 biosynthesis ABC-type transport system permease subunit